MRRTACSTVGATHCTVVLMPRMFFVPTEPSGLRYPSNVYPSSGARASGVAVAIGQSASGGACGTVINPSCNQLPRATARFA
jgi:hypothetical protein